MKYAVTTTVWFSAAHAIRGYNGECENIHGHNWKVELEVAAEKLDALGFVIDFVLLEKLLKNEVLSHLEHKNLNETKPFDAINPSAENIAAYIYQKSEALVKNINPHAHVSSVKLWELHNCYASVNHIYPKG